MPHFSFYHANYSSASNGSDDSLGFILFIPIVVLMFLLAACCRVCKGEQQRTGDLPSARPSPPSPTLLEEREFTPENSVEDLPESVRLQQRQSLSGLNTPTDTSVEHGNATLVNGSVGASVCSLYPSLTSFITDKTTLQMHQSLNRTPQVKRSFDTSPQAQNGLPETTPQAQKSFVEAMPEVNESMVETLPEIVCVVDAKHVSLVQEITDPPQPSSLSAVRTPAAYNGDTPIPPESLSVSTATSPFDKDFCTPARLLAVQKQYGYKTMKDE